ncbi:hypothetical protein [Clostridium sp.]|jgi:hypothetical protein|uniref:hypothetical protein n=1 Tax=Clostridium sp. TaxID=1506 RepID=UPI002590412C|nr:hypothetical protein [Clostridium sp.]MDF2503627.1 hypothetical protein [Clostridium sp.]
MEDRAITATITFNLYEKEYIYKTIDKNDTLTKEALVGVSEDNLKVLYTEA